MQTFSDLRPRETRGDQSSKGSHPSTGPSQSLVQGPSHSLHHNVMSANVTRLSDDNKHWIELCILCLVLCPIILFNCPEKGKKKRWMVFWSISFYLSFCVEIQKQLGVCQPELINLCHFLLVTPLNRILRKLLDEINISWLYNAQIINIFIRFWLHLNFISDK